MKNNLKSWALAAIVCAFALPLQAGIIFDDPVEFAITWQPKLFGKDQMVISLAGKHQDLLLIGANYSIEVTYADRKTTLNVYQSVVGEGQPLVVELAEGLKGIRKVTLKAKWPRSTLIYRFKKNAPPIPKNAAPKEIIKHLDLVKGLKVDSSWTVL